MKISKKTKIAIIGDPVSHSLSPILQNAAFQALGLPFRYTKIRLKKERLPSFFRTLRQSPYAGLNVTVPHKEAALKYMDSLSQEAQLIGAVNTVRVDSGGLQGFNTDAAGYLTSLKKETKFSPRGKRVVILGAGGAARAIIAALALSGAKEIHLLNRTLSRARKLAAEFQKKFPKIILTAAPLHGDHLKDLFPNTDLLINTTSAGLKGSPLPPLPLEQLPRRAVVSDILYRPPMTPFLRKAKKHRLKTHGGAGMLLHQGALSFEIWTHRRAPLSVMSGTLKKALRNR
jgi:shikimate dehydrogenase